MIIEVPWRRTVELRIDDRFYRVAPSVLAHFKTMTASLASLASICTRQVVRIEALEADLKRIRPPRWTPEMKRAVVLLATTGPEGRAAALHLFNLPAAELNTWIDRYNSFGIDGLKSTRLQQVGRGGGL